MNKESAQKELDAIKDRVKELDMYKNIVIVDIDGTISKVGDRLKYLQQKPMDLDAYYADSFEDEPIEEMINLVQSLFEECYDIVLCTSRFEFFTDRLGNTYDIRMKTIKWIRNHFTHPFYSQTLLLMRKNGDERNDLEIKPELLLQAGIELDSIAFVLEDKTNMVEKWRSLGLICLQVANNNL